MANVHTRNNLSINDLDSLANNELKALYEDLLKTAPPKRASSEWLSGNIAWALQVLQQKKDPLKTRLALLKLTNSSKVKNNYGLSTGTCLIREWQGQTYEVTVLENGYLWQGNCYPSLSQIALQITDTKWSGPRFFGLKKRKNGS